jgi:glucose dehydrogenase
MKSSGFQSIRLISFLIIVTALITPMACSNAPAGSQSPVSSSSPAKSPVASPSIPAATPTVTSLIPPEVAQYAKDWPLPNRDYNNSRATADSKINSGNINSLGVAWAVPITGVGLFGAASANPIIANNAVYFQDLSNNVYAVDLATGAVKWQKIYDVSNVGPNGVAIGSGKVFATSNPYNIVALEAGSGKELWSAKVSDNPTVGTDIQPIVYDGMVYTSTVPGSSGSNFYSGGGIGAIIALDQATGKTVWSFDTVDSKELWGNKIVNSGGGCWYSPAIDQKTGVMYWAVANPAPWPGTTDFPNGSSRPGNNLYTNSLVALDYQSGKPQWYNQVVPHDIKDYDLQVAPIIASVKINDKLQDIVIGAGKMGKVYAFDRKTGALLWNTPVGVHQNDDLKEFSANQTTTVFPGFLGGVETPMAYADGVVYVPVVNLSGDYTPSTRTLASLSTGKGQLVAIKADTGAILWDKQLDSMNFGGATVVNDLVFTATFDGTFYAFNRDTGDAVWSYKAPGGVNAWRQWPTI